MKYKLAFFCVLTSVSLVFDSTMSMAASKDYGKIKRDISVMTRIISGSIQDEDSCQGCRVHVKANYLAAQGAVFTIENTSSGFVMSNFRIIAPEALEALENLPQVVGSLLRDFGAPLADMDTRIEIYEDFSDHGDYGSTHFIIDRSAIRDLRRQTRDLELQMHDHEIEILHAAEENRAELEESLADLEEAREELENQREGMNKKYETARKERDKEREKRKLERLRKETEVLVNIQNLIMQSFCDYGSTLKNLPENEYVSVVFEQRRDDTSLIYVLKRNDVTKCNSDGATLIKKALSYQF